MSPPHYYGKGADNGASNRGWEAIEPLTVTEDTTLECDVAVLAQAAVVKALFRRGHALD